jgi:hypothetical protein
MRIAGWIALAAMGSGLQAGRCQAAHDVAPAPADVTVYLEDGNAMLNLLTKSMVGRMFEAAGVRVAWRAGHPRPDAARGLAVTVRMTETAGSDRERRVMGRTFPFGAGVHRIDVFLDTIRARADASQVDEYKITAHVLAHEIGHLLEGIDHHSGDGIMKACWTRDDYRTMARQPLAFAEEDLEMIRSRLEKMR